MVSRFWGSQGQETRITDMNDGGYEVGLLYE